MAEAAGSTLRTDLLQQLAKVLVVFRLELWQALQLRGHIKRLPVFLLRHVVEWGAPNRRGRSHQLACWRPDGRIPAERLQTGLEILLPVPDEAISFQGTPSQLWSFAFFFQGAACLNAVITTRGTDEYVDRLEVCLPCWRFQHLVALSGKHGVQLLIRQKSVPLLNLPLHPHCLHAHAQKSMPLFP